ncbi:MAG: hypothetical protein L6R40_005316 [Gallowayella cf. fulva]|nr:MAG: hypothetical protein L6R40_005316 [Xanthomendoza cf. fulva]
MEEARWLRASTTKGQKSSAMKMLGGKKWTKDRDEWLQTVSRGMFDDGVGKASE